MSINRREEGAVREAWQGAMTMEGEEKEGEPLASFVGGRRPPYETKALDGIDGLPKRTQQEEANHHC